MKKMKKRSNCPVSLALEVVGDKWSLLIIRDIMLFGKRTYNDLLHSREKIATNILADRLSKLESFGILEKQGHPRSKSKFIYSMTEKGMDLRPVLFEIAVWGDKHLCELPNQNEFLKSFWEKSS